MPNKLQRTYTNLSDFIVEPGELCGAGGELVARLAIHQTIPKHTENLFIVSTMTRSTGEDRSKIFFPNYTGVMPNRDGALNQFLTETTAD